MCEFCNNIPTYPKINTLNEDLGISIIDNKIQLCSETYNLLVHTTNHILINYCPICGKKLTQTIESKEDSNLIKIYTDGAFRPSVKQGGWSYIVTKNNSIIDSDYNGVLGVTNNIMELFAVLKALIYIIKHKITKSVIYTDSQYVWGCATQNWKRSKNKKLWEKYDTLINSLSKNNLETTIEWVKGHADNNFNNKADELAVKGSKLVL